MKKIVLIFICMLLAFTLIACAAPKTESLEESSVTAQIANPYTEYATLDEARTAVGFDFKLPTVLPAGFGLVGISVMSSDDASFAQLVYQSGDSKLTYRTAVAPAQLDGDYTQYEKNFYTSVGDISVYCRGGGDWTQAASWETGGYAYCVMCDTPVMLQDLTNLVASIS